MATARFVKSRALNSCGTALAIAFALSEPALGTGFFINQQSVRGMGRVDAGNTATADDLSTIFYNPAGLPRIWQEAKPRRRVQISIDLHLIIPSNDLRNRGSSAATPGTLGGFVPVAGGDGHNPTDPTPVPNVYVAAPLFDGRAAFGLGINAPFGLATAYNSDWHGRYDAIEASLKTINVGIVGAFQLNSRLSIGGGLDLQYARTSLTSAIPNPVVPGGPEASTDARIKTTGHAVTPGFNLGVLYGPSEDSRVGFHYRSGVKHNIEGSSEIVGLPAALSNFNGTVDARADLNLPAMASVGVRTKVEPKLVLLGEFVWFDWSTFKEIRIRFADGRPDAVRPANYRDAYAVAGGAEYALGRDWIARGGLHYDTTPTVDGSRDTTVPDSNRLWLGLGATFHAMQKVSIDLAFNHVLFRDTGVALTRTFFDGTPVTSAVNVKDDVKSAVTNVSVGFRFRF